MKKIKINYNLFFAAFISGLIASILVVQFSFSLLTVSIIGALIGVLFGIFSKKN